MALDAIRDGGILVDVGCVEFNNNRTSFVLVPIHSFVTKKTEKPASIQKQSKTPNVNSNILLYVTDPQIRLYTSHDVSDLS